jgi:predicted dehydrogenase
MKTKLGIIGAGSMARFHLRDIIKMEKSTDVTAICEPSDESIRKAEELFEEAGKSLPPHQPDLDRFLEKHAEELDAVYIITPHVFHHEQAKRCMKAGLDVLLEKPMVMNAEEAESLIQTRDVTGKLLVVGFQGGLSPAIRKSKELLRSAEFGDLLTINGTVWQNWGSMTVGTWRQKPAVSGGGFMFDTGAHMLNTVCDLAGQDFVRVAAWLDDRSRPVDVLASVMGRLESGALVTIAGCGETVRSCASDIFIFCTKGIIRTGQWGERLEIQRDGEDKLHALDSFTWPKAWEVFLQVKRGEIPNPCPPEVGLRMAKLWDAIRASAALDGRPVDPADRSAVLEKRN